MSKELVIGSNRHETKVAILEDDQLVEVYFQRANEYSLAGSIHKGRVTRVLPGMQSAFVDLGLERDTFLYVSDFFEENEDIDTVAEDKPNRGDKRDRDGSRSTSSDRPNGGERQTFERPPVKLAAPEPAMALAEPLETFDDPEPLEEEPGVITSTPAVISERREAISGEPAGERGVQGDRRGRRSRRRRQRPGGIPDNKYAQPSESHRGPAPVIPSPSTSATVGERGRREFAPPPIARPIFSEATEVSQEDVILLPGESLAKYRNKPPISPVTLRSQPVDPPELSAQEEEAPEESHQSLTEEPQVVDPPEPDTGYGDAGADSATEEDDRAPEEDLAAEAEEIALTDRILSHHDEPPEIEDAKIAEVQQDVPDERFHAEEPSREYMAEFRAESLELQEETPFSSYNRETVSSVRIFEEHDGGATPSTGPHGLDEFEILAIKEGLTDVDEPMLDEADLAGEPASTDLAVNEAPAPPAISPLASEGTAQTASVREREEGSRFTHRSSRRMRRRRGGTRLGGQQSPADASETERPSGLAQGTAGGAGAGLALAPEARTEPRRESSEERTLEKSEREKEERVYPSISDLLKPGQEIIVQIAKEPLGQKGARITSHIALPGRYVVFMPSVHHLGVSRKVESEEERQRLKRILQAHRVGTTGGFIVRTAGEGIPEEEIAADMNFLYSLWLDIRQKAEKKPAPALLHYDLDVVQRILRDQVTEEFKAIWVDNEDLYESVLTFMQRFQPAFVNRVKMYTRPAPIFDAFNITQELEKALRPKVWLKSGGYIVINQTEALVAIDINTGKYVGKSNRLEDTIVKTNTEAVKEIVRQIRLRDLGGIIVVDFIDMDERKNRQKVMQALEEAMQADKAPYKILQFNDFGLVAITRKRVKQSLERTLCSPCPYCEGAGYVKSVQTVISEILVEAQKIARAIEGKDVVLRVHPEVAKVLKASDNQFLEETEEILGRPVLVVGDPTLHHQKFDLA